MAQPIGVEQELAEAGLDREVAIGHLDVVDGRCALDADCTALLLGYIWWQGSEG